MSKNTDYKYINIKVAEDKIKVYKQRCKDNFIDPLALLRGFIKTYTYSNDDTTEGLCKIIKPKK